jgi:hypothetical protein
MKSSVLQWHDYYTKFYENQFIVWKAFMKAASV